ncbi:hypothetical protein N7491_008738 [Penicillium cf. griseofulvum]|uniref:Uncharacterized protein n=1 Tax=Penicillium cf. griseofulvum TaxID=2972120 RepID=A0A9W9MER9_9EURO|nr:hypothetical protein N7472_005660 [Penicillium cf. griseofulvum]KAJ5423522.1 hypothetical protein N7491_008738 [Penicillium cf. griseofulvum]
MSFTLSLVLYSSQDYCLLTLILRHWHCPPIHSEQVCPYRPAELPKIHLLFLCLGLHPCVPLSIAFFNINSSGRP